MSATAPAAQPPYVQARNGLGVAALVCGLIGALAGLIPILFFIALPLGILGLVFGWVGMRRASRGEATNRGMAISGLILGVIGTGLAIWGITIVVGATNQLQDDLNNLNTSSSASAASFQTAQQRVDRQEHKLIHEDIFIGNQ